MSLKFYISKLFILFSWFLFGQSNQEVFWVEKSIPLDIKPNLNRETIGFKSSNISLSKSINRIVFHNPNHLSSYELDGNKWEYIPILNSTNVGSSHYPEVIINETGSTIGWSDQNYDSQNSLKFFELGDGDYKQKGQTITLSKRNTSSGYDEGEIFEYVKNICISNDGLYSAVKLSYPREIGARVNIYKYSNGNWQKLGASLFLSKNGNFGGKGFYDFGMSMDFSNDGKYLVVGSKSERYFENEENGVVRFYEKKSTHFQIIDSIVSNYSDSKFFGNQVEISKGGEIVTVSGAKNKTETESVNIKWGNLKWSELFYLQQFKKKPSGFEPYGDIIEDVYQFSTSSSGDTIAVKPNSNRNTIIIYKRKGNNWVEIGKPIIISEDEVLSKFEISKNGRQIVLISEANNLKEDKFYGENRVRAFELSNTPQLKLPSIIEIQQVELSSNYIIPDSCQSLKIKYRNVGVGNSDLLKVLVSTSNEKVYCSFICWHDRFKKKVNFPLSMQIQDLPSNSHVDSIVFPIKSDFDIRDTTVMFNIEIEDVNNGFKVNESYKFSVKNSLFPKLEVKESNLTELNYHKPNNQININEMVQLSFFLQNLGSGDAKDIVVEVLNKQEGIRFIGVGDSYEPNLPEYQVIKAGDYKKLELNYFIENSFVEDQVKFELCVKEKYNLFGFDKQLSFPINKDIPKVIVDHSSKAFKSVPNQEIQVKSVPTLTSDVDINIPPTNYKNTSIYALIIGNEDYQSRQTGLSAEQNVDFALNDALVFSQYCNKTLGIPDKQIKVLKNATYAEMYQGLSWIENLAKIENGNAKLIFYYSGHGLPDQVSKEPYLIPVDVLGTNVNLALKLEDVFKKLSNYPSQQVTVFLDACFSGGARNESLVAMKGMKIKPQEESPLKNMVVFSSSSGEQTSAVYREKQHGYFTYFLLKKLQESKGEVSLGELSDYISSSVKKETALNGIIQTPQIKVEKDIENSWKNMKLTDQNQSND